MFQEVLRNIVEQTEGSVAGFLMGFDGIPVADFVRDTAKIDVTSIGAEYGNILKEIRKAADLLDAGSAREVSIGAERMTAVMRVLNGEYFVAIALEPNGNLGKARFLLRTNASKLLEAL